MDPTTLDPGMPDGLPPIPSREMRDFLHKADDAYYSGMEPLIGDYEYDLLAAAAGHEPFVTAELPSLNNARRDEDLDDWLSTVPEAGRLYHLELKIDGVSVLVHYEHGEPVAARSRKLDVPLGCLDLPRRADGFTGTARGEAWHPLGRAYAAGRLRAKDDAASVRWTAHAGCIAERQVWSEQYRNPVSVTTDDAAQIWDLWQLWCDDHYCHDGYPPNDGLVVSVVDPAVRRRMGMGRRAPNWSLALK